MNEIKLNKLSLHDFQGGTFTLDAGGKDTYIFAANAVGKTRLVSAFTWLLFNKDALGRSDFEIKNLDAQGEAAHGLEHTVEADLDVNGQTVNLKKVYKEKWTKKRGNAQREFSGHTTDYFVNGVPIQEKDYLSRISEIAGDESRFRLLTSPTTFPALHWQKQRALLLEVCGDISDSDVIDSDSKLSALPGILGKRSLDDHRKVVTSRRTEINKEMTSLPIRIDEVHRGLPDITGIDRGTSEKDAQRLETALNDAKLRLQGTNTGGAIGELTKKLSGLNADLRKLEEGHRSGSLATLNRLNQQISEVNGQVIGLKRQAVSLDEDLKTKDRRIQMTDSQLAELRKRWGVVDSEIFRDSTVDICPACGQSLPSERVQNAREKALSVFNLSKAQRLGDIDSGGKDLRAHRDRLSEEIDALKKEREIVSVSLPETEAKLLTLTGDRDVLKHSSEDFSEIPGRNDLVIQVDEIEAEIKAERDSKVQNTEKIKAEVAKLEIDLSCAKGKVDLFTRREQGEKRIEELKAEEKKLAKEFEKLEGELYLMDQFIRAKVSMLTDRINSKFETVRFKLFNVLINQGLEEVCQITVGGVPIDGGLNNGARINAGLEIVKVLQQHYQLKAPVFADNAEAVNNLFNVGSQMIRLFVSEDKQLRVEFAAKERMAA